MTIPDLFNDLVNVSQRFAMLELKESETSFKAAWTQVSNI